MTHKSRDHQAEDKNVEREAESGKPKGTRHFLGEPLSNWLLVTVTALLVGVSWLQWQASRQAISDSRAAFEAGNRAYICLKEFKISEKDNPPEHPAMAMRLVNSGKTPAMRFSLICNIMVRDSMVISEEPGYAGRGVRSVGTVAPESIVECGGFPDQDITAEMRSAMAAKKKFLMIYGVAEYEDIFHVKRKSKFCAIYDRTKPDLAICDNFNEID